MKSYCYTFLVCLLLHLCAGQVWCASNMEVRITVTINTSPTISMATTLDSNNDGYLDQIRLDFDQLIDIDDSLGGADGLSGIIISDGYQIVPADYSISNTMSLILNIIPKTVPDTGATPIISFAPNVGTNITSAATGLPMDNHGLISTDGAAPVLMEASSSIGSSIVYVRLSEAGFSRTDASGVIETSDLAYNNNSGNAGPALLGMNDDDASDLFFSINLDNPLVASDFGSDSISFFDNSIYDAAGIDTGSTSTVLRLIDTTAPTITAIETRDRNSNGYIDAILIRLDENIADSSIVASDFIINGTGTLSLGSDPAEFANDNLILLTFSDNLLLSDATPQSSYTAGTLSDLYGNTLASTSPVNATDKAGPAVLSAETISTNEVRVTLSEAVDDSSLDADDFFFNGFISASGNGLGIAINSGTAANDQLVVVTLPGSITADETGIISFDSPHVTLDLPGNWNQQNTGVPITDGNNDSGPPPALAFAPRIVSEAQLWTLEDEEWHYDIEVDVRELIEAGHLGLLPQFNLQWQLNGTIPTGMTVTKTGALTARISWPRATGNNEHIRITVEVTDEPSSTEDEQDVLIHITENPSSGL